MFFYRCFWASSVFKKISKKKRKKEEEEEEFHKP